MTKIPNSKFQIPKDKIVAVVLILTIVLAGTPHKALAQIFTIPFGGRIKAILPPVPFECWLPRIVVGPPRPGIFAIAPWSRIYAWWIISLQHWVLGLAIPPIPGLCTSPIIEKIGTGAIP